MDESARLKLIAEIEAIIIKYPDNHVDKIKALKQIEELKRK